jgi:hypothetical protein
VANVPVKIKQTAKAKNGARKREEQRDYYAKAKRDRERSWKLRLNDSMHRHWRMLATLEVSVGKKKKDGGKVGRLRNRTM